MKSYKIIVQDQQGNSHNLDLDPNVEVEIVYNIQDISQPDKRKISFIKEFIVPGTKNNKKLFRPLFDNGYSVEQINPNKGMSAQFTNNNIVFDGKLQIVEVVQTDTIINFKVAIYSNLADFFNQIKGKNFNGNIDLSMFNHPLTIDKIEKSWNNIITRNGQEFKSENGTGYVYPMEDRATGISIVNKQLVFEADKWRPAIFIKTLVDRVFETHGFSYDSKFFESPYFKSLILPFSRERLIPSTENRESDNALVGFSTSGTDVLQNYAITKDVDFPGYFLTFNTTFDNPITDPGNLYSIPNKEFTIGTAGKYTIVSQENFNLKFDYEGATNDTFYIRFRFWNAKVKNDLDNQPSILTRIRKNGVIIKENKSFFNIDGSIQRNKTANFTITAGAEIADYTLLTGDKISIEYRLNIPDGARANRQRTNIFWRNNLGTSKDNQFISFRRLRKASSEDQSFSIAINEDNEIGYGDTVMMNNVLPEFTMENFFRSLNRMFNLQWKPLSDNTIQIEPYDELFKDRNAKDWTYKVDRNLEKIITPMSELSSLEYLFSYETDNDWANEEYELSSDKGFGARRISVENDFLEGNTDIIPNFSSTPLTSLEFGSSSGYEGDDIEALRLTEFIIPSYTRKDDSGNKSSMKPKHRILFWGGLVDSPSFDLRVLESVNDDLSFNWLEEKRFSKYPYAGHLNSPIAPTEDLSYGVPTRFFHEWKTITNNNLFNKFWRNWIVNIVDPRSHMLTVTMKMSDVDMNNFNFSDLIQIDNSYYSVIKINFKPISNIAVVNLLKNIETNDFTPMLGYRGLVGMKFASNAINKTGFFSGMGASNTNYNLQSPSETSVGNYWIGNQLGQSAPMLFDYNEEAQGTLFPYETVDRPLFRQGEDYLPIILSDESKENGNLFHKSSLVTVSGFYNRVGDKPMGPISILGSNNDVNSGSENINITGNNNFVGTGLKNVNITGDGYTINESDITIIHGIVIRNGAINQNIDLVQGGINEVQNPFNPIKLIWKIDGGHNAVLNLGSNDINEILDGN